MREINSILSLEQLEIIRSPLDVKIFLEGKAGTGKTSAGVARLVYLLKSGVPGDSILVLLPQRTLAEPFYHAINQPGLFTGGAVSILTFGGLAQRMIALFWPLILDEAGFSETNELPTFLTLETAQYYMAHLLKPLLDEGMFDSITIDRNRLYSQIIDNINKAAVVGFPHTEIGERLKAAWVGDPAQANVFDDVQTCVNIFREFCLSHNLVDFSLQIELFQQHLWNLALCRNHLLEKYKHLVFDNLEEDTPVAHDIIHEWLPEFDSAFLIFDSDAGYRRFLGADPQSAYRLKKLCNYHVSLHRSFICSINIQQLEHALAESLEHPNSYRRPMTKPEPGQDLTTGAHINGFEFKSVRYNPEMLDWMVDRIAALIFNEGISPGEIVVLAPYMPDALRFMIMSRMHERNIPAVSHRPSRALREEPAAQCLLTLAALAFPEWGVKTAIDDVTRALMTSIQDVDLIRARLLTQIVYRENVTSTRLSSFDLIKPDILARITYRFGEKYENFRIWLHENRTEGEELDWFFSRLFGEVLSQPGYGFYRNYDAARITANLIESVQKFRRIAGKALTSEDEPLGKEYLIMVQEGVIASQYVRAWKEVEGQAVFIAPAYTFLMRNRPVDVQFWLDIGSRGWYERLDQPLTHPYVLSRGWSQGRLWTDKEEHETSMESMQRLLIGLLRRCRERVFVGISELGTSGYEQRGPLLQAIQRILLATSQ